MRREFCLQLWRHGLTIESLLQNVERPHTLVAPDQQFAVDRGWKPQSLEQVGKTLGDLLPGARIKAGNQTTVPIVAGNGLHPDAVPFPLCHEIARIEARKVGFFRCMREYRWTTRRRVLGCGLVRPSFQPRKKIEIWRRQTRPQNLDLVGLFLSERGRSCLGETRRNADAQSSGDQLQKGPAAGFVQPVEPSSDLRRKLCLSECR